MTSKLVLACSATALALAACDGPPPPPPGVGPNAVLKVGDRLTCPESQGDLERVRVEPDGRTCLYRGARGAEVELKLTPISGGSADATLAALEARLRPLSTPAPVPAATAAPAEAAAAAKEAATVEKQSVADAGPAAADPDPDPDIDIESGEHERVNVRLPGLHIDAEDERANIRIGPIRINADDAKDRVNIVREPKTGVGRSFSVNAGDGHAEIRSDDGGKANVKATLILASDTPGPQGHKVVGYVARGPRGGPLVVATVRVKDKQKGDVYDDANALVKRNVRR